MVKRHVGVDQSLFIVAEEPDKVPEKGPVVLLGNLGGTAGADPVRRRCFA